MRIIRKIIQKILAGFKCVGIDLYAIYKSEYPALLLRKATVSEKDIRDDGLSLAFEFSVLNSHAQVGRDFAKKLSQTDFPFSTIDVSLPGAAEDQIPIEEISYIKTLAPATSNNKRVLYFSSTNIIKSSRLMIAETPFWEFEDGFEKVGIKLLKRGRTAVTFTDFCYDVISKEKRENLKVYKMRYPFLISDYKYDRNQIRTKYGINTDAFAVFYNFNLGACADRKNPKGTIMTFSKAFTLKDNVVLVFKISGASDATSLNEIITEAENLNIRDRLILITESLTHDEIMKLTGSCDCYMSLHRGEGLGLGMLEAMSVHIPVIATAYGGNMEFCKEDTAFLVPYTLVTPNTDFPTYKGVTKWAEPDIDAAAKYLREIYDNRELGKAKADTAYNFVQDYYSLENFEKDLRRLLEEW